MKLNILKDPETGLKMLIEDSGNILLENNTMTNYKISHDMYKIVFPKELHKEEKEILNWYDNNYEVYDEYLPLTFETFNVNEVEERKRMISKLNLKPNSIVLETGAGTGRDSILIANELCDEGHLYVTDLHEGILRKAIDRLKDFKSKSTFVQCNAIELPFEDNSFDAYYHFGGFNTFSDKTKAFEEIARVVKPGGRVLIGDESMPIWLRETEFGKILMNSNPHYKYKLPLDFMHESSRDVELNYIIGGVFYFISYTVGVGMPEANFDFQIPGIRGGTHRTRYYGLLEGVSIETKKAVTIAAAKAGLSIYDWLENVINVGIDGYE